MREGMVEAVAGEAPPRRRQAPAGACSQGVVVNGFLHSTGVAPVALPGQ